MNTTSDLETISRTCTVCGKTYPATAEYFGRTKNTKSGLVAHCKACNAVRVKEWQHKNPDRVRAYKDKARTAAPVAPEKKAQYRRTYRKRTKARLDRAAQLEQLLAEKDARIAELEAKLKEVLP